MTSDLVHKLNLSGLLMFEFLFDENDCEYKLIEINPRIWGSILLSETGSNELISDYINLSNGKSLNINKENEINNIFIRWVLQVIFFIICLIF